jgi:hypothetical protein
MPQPAKKQRIRLVSRKKVDNTFSLKSSQNVLGAGASHTSERPKDENLLELVDALCLLANAVPPAGAPLPPDHEMREGAAAAFEFLGQAQGKVSLDETLRNFRMYRETPGLFAGIPEETLYPVYVLRECATLGHQLTFLIACRNNSKQFAFQEGHIAYRTSLDPATRRPTLEPFAYLGPYHNVLLRVLGDPKIDVRRFQCCAVCKAFFYQPRLSSRACSRKCVDVLMARERYARLQTALQLQAQGKSTAEIAAHLHIAPGQVRRYLKQRR